VRGNTSPLRGTGWKTECLGGGSPWGTKAVSALNWPQGSVGKERYDYDTHLFISFDQEWSCDARQPRPGDDAGVRLPGGDGTTWATAYKYLQDALNTSTNGDEIHVAGGTYKPDLDEAGLVTPGNREATFQLVSGVEVYGGYRGCPGGDCGGGDRDERDIELHETVLSGDIGAAGTSSDNSYHVVTGSGCADTTLLDGVTITAGHANGGHYPVNQDIGGGMYTSDPGCPATLAGCTFSGNYAAESGGARYHHDGAPVLSDCTFAVCLSHHRRVPRSVRTRRRRRLAADRRATVISKRRESLFRS